MLRIRDEEAMLKQELEGYTDHTRHVRYRLLPGLW
jgi:protein-S-isoprenylcysteine O-methyltransferase Ste14